MLGISFEATYLRHLAGADIQLTNPEIFAYGECTYLAA